MKIEHWITIGSVIAVIAGWFINGHLNRRHELYKKKVELRFKLYDSCVAVANTLEKIFQSKDQSKDTMNSLTAEFLRHLEQCQIQILMFGTQSEINAITELTKFAQQNKHGDMKKTMAELMRSIRSSLRSDLKLEKIKFDDAP